MTNETPIFVVDDDDAVRDSLKALLETGGLSVETYASGQEFLDAYDPSRRGCLLLDVRMPDMTGLELQQKLAARPHKLSIIIITGHGDVPMAVKAMKVGAADFIEKPYSDETILESVHNACESGAPGAGKGTAVEETTARIALLSPREREVLDQLIIGHQNKMIAYELGISPRTVEIHRSRVMAKMQAKSLPQLVRMALTAGIDPLQV
ncbi:MAG: response regulator transcription factor [Proteobacteria bacterium]|nr:response regulator transcription factor [Pseudomonadota bacterium]